MSGRDSSNRRQILRRVGAAGLAGLAGCGRLGPSGGSGSDTVTLEYVEVAGSRSREVYQPVVDELNDRYEETIELDFTEIPYGNIRKQLQTRVGGGNPPDIAAIDQIWIGSFIDGGALLPLDRVAASVDVDDYMDQFVDVARSDGQLFAVPITTDVRGMYWNRQAFEEAGLDPYGPPETWTDLLDVAERLHDPPTRYGAGYFVVGGRWTVNLFAGGGQVLDDDGRRPRFHEQPGVEAAAFLDELYNERAVGPQDPPYEKGAQMAREFLRGDYAITVVDGSWLDYFWRNMGNDDGMAETFGFAPTPRPQGGEAATMSGGHMWAGFRGTDHVDVVEEFLRIAAGREFKRHLAIQSGQIPTRESLQDDSDVWEPLHYGDVVRDLLDNTHLRPVRNWSVVAEELDPALQRIAFDRAEPAEALEGAAAAVRSELR